jgi:hypothetical protein
VSSWDIQSKLPVKAGDRLQITIGECCQSLVRRMQVTSVAMWLPLGRKGGGPGAASGGEYELLSLDSAFLSEVNMTRIGPKLTCLEYVHVGMYVRSIHVVGSDCSGGHVLTT